MLPAEGADLTLTTKATGPLKVTLLDASAGYPDIPGFTVEPRPAGMMAVSEMHDQTVVRKTFVVGE